MKDRKSLGVCSCCGSRFFGRETFKKHLQDQDAMGKGFRLIPFKKFYDRQWP